MRFTLFVNRRSVDPDLTQAPPGSMVTPLSHVIWGMGAW